MKKFLTIILFLILTLCVVTSFGCLVYTGDSNGGVTDNTGNHDVIDEFAIDDITIARDEQVAIVFSDESDSQVSYEYNDSYFLIADGYISVELMAPIGSYTIIATNAYTSVEFTVTVVGENVFLTLKNNKDFSPIAYGEYVPSGTSVTVESGDESVWTGSVGDNGALRVELASGSYTVTPDGYQSFDIVVSGYYRETVECNYKVFADDTATDAYVQNGYVNLSSALDFADDGIVYAEMTIYAPSDIATAQNGNQVGGTVFSINTNDYKVNGNTLNAITFGGYWSETYYCLGWTGDRSSTVKTFDTDLFSKLINQEQGVKIAVAIKDGLVYTYVEGSDGALVPLTLSGGQIYALELSGISAGITAKISNVKYSTSLSDVEILDLPIETVINNRGSYSLSMSGLTVSGSHANGYTVTCADTGEVSTKKALQNGYYDLNDGSVISFDFEYTVDSSSKYYPEIRFNDSISLQLCVWNGKLELKYGSTTVAENSYFNGDNNTGTFYYRFAIHADSAGSLAVYQVTGEGESLLYTTASNEKPFDFSMLRRIDIAYCAANANDWAINNLKVLATTTRASVSYVANQYLTFENTFSTISYKEEKTFSFIPIDGYVVSAVKIDGFSVDYTASSSGVYSVTFAKYDAMTTHKIVVEGEFDNSKYTFKTSALASYKIVYDAGMDLYDLATELQSAISSKYGVTLTVGSDTAISASAYEILIGDTNRYDTLGKLMQYSVTVGEGKFKINVGGVISAEKVVDYLVSSIFTGGSFTLTSGEYYTTSLITTQSIASGADLRLMSNNILSTNWDSTVKSAEYRAEIYAGMLVAYAPDVVGLQELDTGWNSALPTYLAKVKAECGYDYALSSNVYLGKNNYTALMYRADKFDVSNETVEVYDWWLDSQFNHNYYMRNVTYAQFASKTDSSVKFVLANTHWSPNTEHVGKTLSNGTSIVSGTLKKQERTELNSLLTTLVNNYSMPIFLTGDFNTSSSYLVGGSLSINSSFTKIIDSSNPQTDYIFGKTGSYTVKASNYFKVGDTVLTDHNFVYADVAI